MKQCNNIKQISLKIIRRLQIIQEPKSFWIIKETKDILNWIMPTKNVENVPVTGQ